MAQEAGVAQEGGGPDVGLVHLPQQRCLEDHGREIPDMSFRLLWRPYSRRLGVHRGALLHPVDRPNISTHG